MSDHTYTKELSQKINGNPAYLIHRHEVGTYLEYAADAEAGVYPAPCELNKMFVVEEHSDDEGREYWDNLSKREMGLKAIQEARKAGLN